MMQPARMIELDRVTKTYGAGHTAVHALREVSLHVERGEIVLVMGPSGSGKTTLLQTVGALLRPTFGAVRVAGADLGALKAAALARLRLGTFGFICQSHNLLASLSALQNVELPLDLAGRRGGFAREKAQGLLRQMGLSGRAHHLPAQLSGGEQQRVAVARALANDPPVLLADEPTASLDSKSGYDVVETIRRLARERGSTVLIVTHDARIKNLADRVLWLEDGRLRLERAAAGTAVDPVCLMVVDPAGAAYRWERLGRRYYFCSGECRDRFQAHPERFDYGA